MLTGTLPFTGETVYKVFKDIVACKNNMDRIPEEALGLVTSMLAKEERNRASAHEVLQHPWLALSARNEFFIPDSLVWCFRSVSAGWADGGFGVEQRKWIVQHVKLGSWREARGYLHPPAA